MGKQKNIPLLRFPDFKDEWKQKKFGTVTNRVTDPVDVEPEVLYQQIGIKSHGKGIFHKEPVDGKSLGSKRVFWIRENVLIVNIVFAWEQAIAITTEKEIGMVASHRFPMYLPVKDQADLNYLLYFFLTKKGKSLLELASPGGAGRNKTLGQKEFEKLTFKIPEVVEQRQIASFISAVDAKLQEIKKRKQILEQYKTGLMQKIFAQKIRFKDDSNREFQSWKEFKLKDVLVEHKSRNQEYRITEVFSVAKNKGVINQIEHLGRSYASAEIGNYKITFPGDIIYTKSPTSDFPFGIIKQNKLDRTGIVSVLYGVFTPRNKEIGTILDFYFSNWKNTFNYLNPLVKKGAKNTINIGNNDFLNGVAILLPTSEKEQIKIVNFLSAIDEKISLTQTQIEKTEQYKKGLLQKMFC